MKSFLLLFGCLLSIAGFFIYNNSTWQRKYGKLALLLCSIGLILSYIGTTLWITILVITKGESYTA